jgi:hypothetical protein
LEREVKNERRVEMAWGPNDRMENFLGCFIEKDYGNNFEYEVNREEDSWLPVSEYPHRVWVSNEEWRYAKVLKTVAYIAVDEDEYGKPVTEKWDIKKHVPYIRN